MTIIDVQTGGMSALKVGARVRLGQSHPFPGEVGTVERVEDGDAGAWMKIVSDVGETFVALAADVEPVADEAASAGPIDEVPGVERDLAFVSSAGTASSTAGLSALRHRVRREG